MISLSYRAVSDMALEDRFRGLPLQKIQLSMLTNPIKKDLNRVDIVVLYRPDGRVELKNNFDAGMVNKVQLL